MMTEGKKNQRSDYFKFCFVLGLKLPTILSYSVTSAVNDKALSSPC